MLYQIQSNLLLEEWFPTNKVCNITIWSTCNEFLTMRETHQKLNCSKFSRAIKIKRDVQERLYCDVYINLITWEKMLQYFEGIELVHKIAFSRIILINCWSFIEVVWILIKFFKQALLITISVTIKTIGISDSNQWMIPSTKNITKLKRRIGFGIKCNNIEWGWTAQIAIARHWLTPNLTLPYLTLPNQT